MIGLALGLVHLLHGLLVIGAILAVFAFIAWAILSVLVLVACVLLKIAVALGML